MPQGKGLVFSRGIPCFLLDTLKCFAFYRCRVWNFSSSANHTFYFKLLSHFSSKGHLRKAWIFPFELGSELSRSRNPRNLDIAMTFFGDGLMSCLKFKNVLKKDYCDS